MMIRTLTPTKLTGTTDKDEAPDVYAGMIAAQAAAVEAIVWTDLSQHYALGKLPVVGSRVAVVDLDALSPASALELADWVAGNIA